MQDLKRESQSTEAALPSTSPNARTYVRIRYVSTLKCRMNFQIFANGYSLLALFLCHNIQKNLILLRFQVSGLA